MFNIPAFEKLADSNNILIAGCGGGYDVFSGLPLYFALTKQGKTVHLANWTFSDVVERPGERLGDRLVAVTAESKGGYYFPEKYLCEWFALRGELITIYCLEPPCGTQQLKRSYNILLDLLKFDTVILVDGGTDSLLRGQEDQLGTPLEDMTSIAAVDQLDVKTKILASLGFGIDAYHGVCHAHVLDSIAEQTTKGGYLGAVSLLRSMPEVKHFITASHHVFNRMPDCTSIVVSSILSAIEGRFGNHHATPRTKGSQLFINPLMGLYWFFDLRSLADSVIYMNDVREAESTLDVSRAIKSARRHSSVMRPWRSIPI